MAAFSAYSLAAINQVYKIEYEWYSDYYKTFTNEWRNYMKNRWSLPFDHEKYKLSVITSREEAAALLSDELDEEIIGNMDFNKYVYLYCSLGKVKSPEYKIKILDIAQRVNYVEVIVGLNSPEDIPAGNSNLVNDFLCKDLVRIDKNSFASKGRIYISFKDA